jgi:small subunit ribosomal protein S14
MAKECLIVKHKKLEAKWAAFEARLAAIENDSSLNKEQRAAALEALEESRIKSRLFRARRYNRCAETGRAKGYYRFFGVCRQSLREKAHLGLLPGVKKSSW